MKNITENFGTVFPAIKAFLFRKEYGHGKRIYVEAYDFDDRGYPINAHPLTVNESSSLARILNAKEGLKKFFLQSEGLMPKNVLYLNSDQNPYIIWHTPERRTALFFDPVLGMPQGEVFIPALIWKASAKTLKIFALKNGSAITLDTQLYHAPFLNIYTDGKVCMGTVKTQFSENCSLEAFMKKWEAYFFQSFFTHHIDGHNPVKENLLTLWKSLVNSHAKFPIQKLVQTGFTLQKILL